MRALIAIVSVVAIAPLACTNFDREDRVEDMRILAVRTEPAEILYSPLHLLPAAERPPFLPLAPIDVAIDVFAFDPRGGATNTTIQLCPEGAGDSSCRLYDREEDVLQEPASARAELLELLTPRAFEGTIDTSEQPAGRVEPGEYEMTFSPSVIDFFIPDDNDGNPVPSVFPLLPRIVVQAENLDVEAPDVQKERALKRIPVALDLTSPELPPEVVNDLAAGLGIELCSDPISEAEYLQQGRATCLERRVANSNPELAGFLVDDPAQQPEGLVTTDRVEPDVAASVVVQAAPGDLLAFSPVFSPTTVERYQVVSFDIEASKIIILNRVEDIACNWYTTRGDVSDTLTAEQFNPRLGVTWQLPTDAEPGERDSLFMVVLDQRGGTAFGEVIVEYQ